MNSAEHVILKHQGMEYFQQISTNLQGERRKETTEMVHQLLPLILQDYRLKLIIDERYKIRSWISSSQGKFTENM